jgi:hypothetical protein
MVALAKRKIKSKTARAMLTAGALSVKDHLKASS